MDDVEMVEVTEFKCPWCGSGHFGSGGLGTEEPTGYCHGYIDDEKGGRVKCNFTWPRSDDTNVFRSTGKFVPKHQEAVEVTKLCGGS